jgi:head-tail adaptor
MTILTIVDDLEHFDGLEPVQLFAPQATTPVGVNAALRRRVSVQEAAASNGAYVETDLKWHLSTREIDAAPEVGATIRDVHGGDWTVLRVEGHAAAGSWKCWCRNVAISARLEQRITIQRAVWRAAASGAPQAHWIDLQTDVPARIQPLAVAVEVRHAHRTARVTHHIFIAEPLSIDDQHRVVYEGSVYHVVGSETSQRIDRLMTILAEQSPWPLASGR